MNPNNENIKEDEIDLREIFRVFVNRKWWFLGSVTVVLLLGLLYVFMQPVTHTATCRFDIGKDYTNDKLSEFYPIKASELNFINIDNTPALFKTEDVFRPLGDLEGVKDYNKWLTSDAVRIALNENTTIFNVSVSKAEKELAGDIVITLVNSFDEFVKRDNKDAFNSFLDTIKEDVKLLENENRNFATILVEFDKELESLYEQLHRFIVDYNLRLVDEIKKESTIDNYSFYSLVMPPNKIQVEIAEIHKEKELYKQEIFSNHKKLMDLENLKATIEVDEEVITDRVEVLTEEPVYKSESNRKRNLIIIVFLSLIVGVVAAFLANYFLNLRGNYRRK
ncbi:MAG: hypothetical protein K9H14_05015 [Actinomycetia bacterium]|nr:hypothetical protein [Actinomycetes bacterium]